MNICLPIKEPFVSGYKHHALPLSILEGGSEIPLEIILQNFLQLQTKSDVLQNPDCDLHWLDFNLCEELMYMAPNPFFDVQILSRKGLEAKALNEMIQASLDQNYYIYLSYDGYYLDNNFAYQRFSFPNNLLIYGYNEQTQNYNIYDYNYIATYKLKELQFNINILSNSVVQLEGPEWSNKIVKLKPKVSCLQELSKSEIKETLTNNLLSKSTIKKIESFKQNDDLINDEPGRVYGQNIYNVLEQFLNGIIIGTHRFNLLPFHTLWEHKKCVSYVVKKLFDGGEIVDDISAIEKDVLVLRSTLIKYRVTNDKELLKKAILSLEQIRMNEDLALNKIVQNLEKTEFLQ